MAMMNTGRSVTSSRERIPASHATFMCAVALESTWPTRVPTWCFISQTVRTILRYVFLLSKEGQIMICRLQSRLTMMPVLANSGCSSRTNDGTPVQHCVLVTLGQVRNSVIRMLVRVLEDTLKSSFHIPIWCILVSIEFWTDTVLMNSKWMIWGQFLQWPKYNDTAPCTPIFFQFKSSDLNIEGRWQGRRVQTNRDGDRVSIFGKKKEFGYRQ